MAKQGGKSKKPRNAVAAARGQRSFRNAQDRHKVNYQAQEKRAEYNRHVGGLTPWQQAQQARARRRAILASAWASSPWRPGDAVNREKSVHEWVVAHKQPATQPA